MQRIYLDGIKDLKSEIPDNWSLPEKEMNHRCQKRIVDLCNDIRADIDEFKQKHRNKKANGTVKVFIAKRGADTNYVENHACHVMADISNDNLWDNDTKVKFLTIEHDMAARRLGFYTLFQPLYSISSFKKSLLDGSLSVLKVFLNCVVPILNGDINDDKFAIMKVIRESSSYYNSLSKDGIINKNILVEINTKITKLLSLWNDGNDPTCADVLEILIETNLFDIPDNLKIVSESADAEVDEDDTDVKLNAIEEALKAPFSEIYKYIDYISGNAKFSTHQGVKGLEFPRVAVIIDDKEAETFRIFSYDKMFGIAKKSDTDITNEREGKETTLDRTKRLLYVTCSRAEESLAIVYYSDDVDLTKQVLIASRWFHDDEIEIVADVG